MRDTGRVPTGDRQVIGLAVAFLAGMLLLLYLGIMIFAPDKPL
jgi:hypothetical protein